MNYTIIMCLCSVMLGMSITQLLDLPDMYRRRSSVVVRCPWLCVTVMDYTMTMCLYSVILGTSITWPSRHVSKTILCCWYMSVILCNCYELYTDNVSIFSDARHINYLTFQTCIEDHSVLLAYVRDFVQLLWTIHWQCVYIQWCSAY